MSILAVESAHSWVAIFVMLMVVVSPARVKPEWLLMCSWVWAKPVSTSTQGMRYTSPNPATCILLSTFKALPFRLWASSMCRAKRNSCVAIRSAAS